MKKYTAPEAISAAHSAPHPATVPAAPAAPAAAPVTTPRGEPAGIFLFAFSTGGRPHRREDYAPIR
ncbi:hypothetical protein [Streptomyces sp. NPDC058401]|uniref:hypothetical protein n=1 Tax=Streptomyces sp. NPDC058401 TaxID=3346480 RepID=UPI0036586299